MLPFASVGATENLLMAATLADGRTEIVNSAREPEIDDLIACLNAMGAQISGEGTGTLVIDGVRRLHGAHHAVVSDRIECGTYACAVGIAGGDVTLVGGQVAHLGAVVRALEEAGVSVTQEAGGMRVRRDGPLRGVDVMTEPYPGFPTGHAGPVHGAVLRGRGRLDDDRDHLREPLHARPGTEPHGCADQRKFIKLVNSQ